MHRAWATWHSRRRQATHARSADCAVRQSTSSCCFIPALLMRGAPCAAQRHPLLCTMRLQQHGTSLLTRQTTATICCYHSANPGTTKSASMHCSFVNNGDCIKGFVWLNESPARARRIVRVHMHSPCGGCHSTQSHSISPASLMEENNSKTAASTAFAAPQSQHNAPPATHYNVAAMAALHPSPHKPPTPLPPSPPTLTCRLLRAAASSCGQPRPHATPHRPCNCASTTHQHAGLGQASPAGRASVHRTAVAAAAAAAAAAGTPKLAQTRAHVQCRIFAFSTVCTTS
jgi:hypothetical protein